MIVSLGMLFMVLALVFAVMAAFNATAQPFGPRGPNWLGLAFACFVASFLFRAVL